MRETYLTQRLRTPRPRGQHGPMAKAHRVFGGGMLGLAGKAWDVLDEVCTLDYMGAAEYEFGVLPRTLSAILEEGHKGNLATFAFVLGPHERKLSWERQYKSRDGKPFPPVGPVRLYGIAHKSVLNLVEERVRTLAKDDPNIKRGSQLTNSLDPISPFVREDPVVGWIELDNGFLFFSDEVMWRSFCKMFGAEPCDVPKMPEVTDYTKMKKPELAAFAFRLGIFHTKTAAKKTPKPELLKLLMDSQDKRLKADCSA